MATTDQLRETVAELEALADLVKAADGEPGGWAEAPELLRGIERTLLALSAGWSGVAALAAPTISGLHGRGHGNPPVETGLSLEQEVQLISALHDVSTDLTAAARSCRNGRSIVEHLIDRRLRARERNGGSTADRRASS